MSPFTLGFGSTFLNAPLLTLISFTATHHPLFDEMTLQNNLGLIETPNNVVQNDNIKIISLMLPNSNDFINQQTSISGFGRISDESSEISLTLQWTYMRVISNDRCIDLYGNDIVDHRILCGEGYADLENGPCGGDSGGPLVLRDNDESYQIGIISFASDNGCSSTDPVGFTRTDQFLEWINEVTEI